MQALNTQCTALGRWGLARMHARTALCVNNSRGVTRVVFGGVGGDEELLPVVGAAAAVAGLRPAGRQGSPRARSHAAHREAGAAGVTDVHPGPRGTHCEGTYDGKGAMRGAIDQGKVVWRV